MDSLQVHDTLPYLVGGGGIVSVFLAGLARKFFVNWSKENVSIHANETTSTMMENFHAEIKRLADSNAEFAKENASLRKQISRLEGILEKLAVRFDIDLTEFTEEKH